MLLSKLTLLFRFYNTLKSNSNYIGIFIIIPNFIVFLKKNKKEELEWLNRDGSTAMRARYYKPREEPSPIYMMEDNYLYYKDGEWLTYEDLLIQVLINL